MPFNFSDPIHILSEHSLANPVLFRVNKERRSGKADDIHWGHNKDNRWSIPEIEQTYLGTSLSVICEATPWRQLIFGGVPTDKITTLENRLTVCSLDELSEYFVSYIIPREPLRLLDLVSTSAEDFGAPEYLTYGESLEDTREFSRELLGIAGKYDIDGIAYRSSHLQIGNSLYVFDRAKHKLGNGVIVDRRPLTDVIYPLKDELMRSLRIQIV